MKLLADLAPLIAGVLAVLVFGRYVGNAAADMLEGLL